LAWVGYDKGMSDKPPLPEALWAKVPAGEVARRLMGKRPAEHIWKSGMSA